MAEGRERVSRVGGLLRVLGEVQHEEGISEVQMADDDVEIQQTTFCPKSGGISDNDQKTLNEDVEKKVNSPDLQVDQTDHHSEEEIEEENHAGKFQFIFLLFIN